MGLTRIRAVQISDIDYKQSCRVLTATNITLSGGAPSTVDEINLSAGNRILVIGQSNKAQNGIYTVQTLGTGSNGTWVRSQDGNQDGEIEAGMIVMVTEGTTYKDTQWKLITNDPITLGTSELIFELNSAFAFGNIYANGTAVLANTVGDAVTLEAGENITITGNAQSQTITFSVGSIGAGTEIVSGTSNVRLASSGGNAVIAIGGTDNVAIFTQTEAFFSGNVLPAANITQDLGSASQRWKDLWLSNSTIYLGNAQISANSTSLILTNPEGGQTTLSGVSTSIQATTISASGNVTGGNLITSGNISCLNLSASGNVVAKNIDSVNADLAEKYIADADYIPGTVVIFGGDQEITQSTQYADPRVAGVISTAPAYTMNSAAAGLPVALQGRVPCRVVGQIQKGDLVTSSDLPGIATRLDSQHWQPGSAIGKALENYSSDLVGIIEVVVGRF